MKGYGFRADVGDPPRYAISDACPLLPSPSTEMLPHVREPPQAVANRLAAPLADRSTSRPEAFARSGSAIVTHTRSSGGLDESGSTSTEMAPSASVTDSPGPLASAPSSGSGRISARSTRGLAHPVTGTFPTTIRSAPTTRLAGPKSPRETRPLTTPRTTRSRPRTAGARSRRTADRTARDRRTADQTARDRRTTARSVRDRSSPYFDPRIRKRSDRRSTRPLSAGPSLRAPAPGRRSRPRATRRRRPDTGRRGSRAPSRRGRTRGTRADRPDRRGRRSRTPRPAR